MTTKRRRLVRKYVIFLGLMIAGNSLSVLAADLGNGVLTGPSGSGLSVMAMISGPTPTISVADNIVSVLPQSAVMLNNVPTSSWTYGCSATSAGMMFGYYDLHGYSNMYAGPYNGGVAPLTGLGSKTSLIATKQGLDGRTTRGHVNDYWIGNNVGGPDPWVSYGSEHAWGDCTADYMGTNQWKWDFINGDGIKDFNVDGGTALFSYDGPGKLYDYIPPASAGLPRTELCHGLRLFAQSRGYSVLENYTQNINERSAGGFTFENYMAEINNGRPVMIQVTGHSMVGVGYNATDKKVFLHDTWGDYVTSMTWGGSYSGMQQQAVTVIRLAPVPEPGTLILLATGMMGMVICYFRRRGNFKSR